ncbi:MAG: hypothetical protein GF331_02740, partial [Chitinivibrionales bacterium]|nr:hypothetical protein [Chitinivibrionales bacterium]
MQVGGAVLACLVTLAGCGLTDTALDETGAVAPVISFSSGNAEIGIDARVRQSLETIEVEVVDSEGDVSRGNFAYSDHEGTIEGVAAGPATVTVNARDFASTIVLSGTAGVEVRSGEIATPAIAVEPVNPS